MTCIVAIKHKDVIYMGADSMGSTNNHCMKMREPKILIKGDFILGVSGQQRVVQIMKTMDQEIFKLKTETEKYHILHHFPEQLRKALTNAGYAKKKDEHESQDSLILFGCLKPKPAIYLVDYNYQILEPDYDFFSVGSGRAIALGSLFSTQTSMHPKIRLTDALTAAAEFNPFVDNNFNFLTLEN